MFTTSSRAWVKVETNSGRVAIQLDKIIAIGEHTNKEKCLIHFSDGDDGFFLVNHSYDDMLTAIGIIDSSQIGTGV